MAQNPFLETGHDGVPLVELKQGLVVYLGAAPGIATVSDVFQLFFHHCGRRIRIFRSTAPGDMARAWEASRADQFRRNTLSDLYARRDWGYMFSDGEDVDSWLFMFHGYRPRSEPGKASFFRFDFDWQVDADFLRQFARALAETTPFLSGFGGYYLQARGDLRYARESYDRVYAISQRYWGVEAHNLDVTVDHVGSGYKCVNWLTLIGDTYRERFPQAIEGAVRAASWAHESKYGTLLESQPRPAIGDRSRQEKLVGYHSVASALEPLQMREHAAFGGNRWTDENTIDYIRRFTSDLL